MKNNDDRTLCAANSYEQKYYFNPRFANIPEDIQKELHVLCVLFTEDVGGVIRFVYGEDGTLLIETAADENDYLYDEIDADVMVGEIQKKRRELLEQLEKYYKVMFLSSPSGQQSDHL
jgi:hypothetical protein